MTAISIWPYNDSYRQQVIDHILHIQREEFGVAVTLAEQPDLQNIPGFYQKDAGNFWVAVANGTIAGTISLLDIGQARGALRKMFVHESYRGKQFGVGQALLETLLQWAREKNFAEILLGTTEKFVAAQRFYEKNNFRVIDKNELPPEFPIMQVDVKFYALSLR
jgi:GNAT superfamily N-acetyltransferase